MCEGELSRARFEGWPPPPSVLPKEVVEVGERGGIVWLCALLEDLSR